MNNKDLPHVLILPEDKRDRQIVNGFVLHPSINQRRIQVLPPAGGWGKVLDSFEKDHAADLSRLQRRVLVLVIDFDQKKNRLEKAKSRIPDHLQERVFILGTRKDPEQMKRMMSSSGSYETIGTKLAEECRTNERMLWNHPELVGNIGELERLNAAVRPWLFS